jgi:tRNA uridine 5-carbamoylmethylation protein Kti12
MRWEEPFFAVLQSVTYDFVHYTLFGKLTYFYFSLFVGKTASKHTVYSMKKVVVKNKQEIRKEIKTQIEEWGIRSTHLDNKILISYTAFWLYKKGNKMCREPSLTV